MKRMSLVLATATGLILWGCSPEEENKSSSSGNPLTAPADYIGAAGQAKNRAEGTLSLTSVKQAIQLFYAQEGRFPKTLQELVSQDYLPKLPAAPTGQKFKYDPNSGELSTVPE